MTRMSLDNVVSGIIEKPWRVIVFGPEGVGKSTFASKTPDPIFLVPEDGTSQLDVKRFPTPTTWEEANEAVDALFSDHEYKTFVIDTLDWLEPLCWSFVCSELKVESIDEAGFGKGYVKALDTWREFLAKLDRLRAARGMNIMAVAHSVIKTFKNPEGPDYDRYELKLHQKTSGVWKEWSDCVAYCTYENLTNESGRRVRGVTGKRIMYTERSAAFDAKNRYGLPQELPFDWEHFHDAMQVGAIITVDDALAQAEELTTSLSEDDRKVAADYVKKANGDVRKLVQVINWMKGKVTDD
jgi:hypothetical protein